MFLGGSDPAPSGRGSTAARGNSEPPSRHLNSADAPSKTNEPNSSTGMRDRSSLNRIETDR